MTSCTDVPATRRQCIPWKRSSVTSSPAQWLQVTRLRLLPRDSRSEDLRNPALHGLRWPPSASHPSERHSRHVVKLSRPQCEQRPARILAAPRHANAAFVPFLYLSSPFLAFLSDSSVRGMNKLRVCSSTDSSIPSAPTSLLVPYKGLVKSAGQQKAAIRANSVGR